MAESEEGGVEWFRLSKPRTASKPAVAASAIQESGIQESALEELAIQVSAVEVPAVPAAVTEPESARPAMPPSLLQIPATTPVPIPAKSPKATFDTFADEPRVVRPVPKPKSGFTIISSKNGETREVQLTSPTLTVAKARMLFKSGWRVHITNAAGRQFAPSEFDEVLKFD
jgi:hypothetical protein